MSVQKRREELTTLNLLFCLMVLWSHCSGHPITVLDHSSWQYGLMISLQRLTFVSVSGFFFLSGVKLTLNSASAPPPPLGRYWAKRWKGIFLPYLLGERAPRWNPDATAAWLGLKMENQRCALFRAVLEGVTLNLNIILESFRRSIPIDELLVVGGGAKGALWCQMMADVYNARIKVPVLLEEATSMGAAVTGGVGVGVFKGFEVIDQMLELNRTVEPDPEAVAAYGPVKEAFEVCYKAMLPVYEYMASHKNA